MFTTCYIHLFWYKYDITILCGVTAWGVSCAEAKTRTPFSLCQTSNSHSGDWKVCSEWWHITLTCVPWNFCRQQNTVMMACLTYWCLKRDAWSLFCQTSGNTEQNWPMQLKCNIYSCQFVLSDKAHKNWVPDSEHNSVYSQHDQIYVLFKIAIKCCMNNGAW